MQRDYVFVSNTKIIAIINRLILLSIQIRNVDRYKKYLNLFYIRY